MKKKEKYGIGNFYNNDDLRRMGTKILEEVGKNPEKYRMGDILHLVNRKVTADFLPMERQFEKQE